jgi:hypothetical protein
MDKDDCCPDCGIDHAKGLAVILKEAAGAALNSAKPGSTERIDRLTAEAAKGKGLSGMERLELLGRTSRREAQEPRRADGRFRVSGISRGRHGHHDGARGDRRQAAVVARREAGQAGGLELNRLFPFGRASSGPLFFLA